MGKMREETSYSLEGIAFGLADGLIMSLGLIIGVAEATTDQRLVIIAGVIGGFANAFGNSIGFYMSQSAERGLQIQQGSASRMAIHVHSKREIYLNSLLAFLCSVGAAGALLLPFIVVSTSIAVVASFALGVFIAFSLGSYVGKISRENRWFCGFKYAAIAFLGAIVSHLIADVIVLL